MNAVAGVDGKSKFGGFLTRKVPKSTHHTNEEEKVLLTSRIHYLHDSSRLSLIWMGLNIHSCLC